MKWRPIPGFDGYEVSSCGSVKSVDRVLTMSNGRTRRHKGRILKSAIHSVEFPYPRVNLGKMGAHSVHYFVAIAWIGPKPGPHYQVRHIDGNPSNCNVENLAWGTPTENQADRLTHGTASIGEMHGKSVLTSSDVIEIRDALSRKIPQSRIAKMYGISQSQVSHINTKRNWTHV